MKHLLSWQLAIVLSLFALNSYALVPPLRCAPGNIIVANDNFNTIQGQKMTGVMIAATCYPVDPPGGDSGYNFWIPDSAPNYREMLSALLTAKARGTHVGLTWVPITLDSGQSMGRINLIALYDD
jgi:hypothetical protein